MKKLDTLSFTFDDFSPIVKDLITSISKGIKFESRVVCENIIIKWMVDFDANQQTWGEHTVTLDEFVKENNVPITGIKLYEILFSHKVKKLEEEKEKLLLEEEKNGISLDDDEKNFMIKRRKGKAWFESDEYKQSQAEVQNIDALAHEARESGLIPEGKGKNDKLLAMYWKSYRAGNMTKENLLEQLELDENVKMGWDGKII